MALQNLGYTRRPGTQAPAGCMPCCEFTRSTPPQKDGSEQDLEVQTDGDE